MNNPTIMSYHGTPGSKISNENNMMNTIKIIDKTRGDHSTNFWIDTISPSSYIVPLL